VFNIEKPSKNCGIEEATTKTINNYGDE